jgi:pyruvate kinase
MNNLMTKRTKIICTIGPSSWDAKMMKRLFKAGMNAARVNASFADHAEMKRVLKVIRDTSPDIAAILDLKGHKIRLNDIGWEPIEVKNGEEVILGTSSKTKSPHGFYVSYKNFAKDVKKGARILIDDGKVQLKITKIQKDDVYTKVIVGGKIKRLKTVTAPGSELKFPALTSKDEEDLKSAVKLGYDYVAASFVRNAEDLKAVKKFILGSKIKVISKVEERQGIENFDEILEWTDAVLIARGDMGVEIPLEKVPTIQREMIQKCREAAKPVIVATHMLESMIENPLPTRAEANDVATAVFQGADCVMLSGETSTGKFPVDAVEVMSRILKETEKDIFGFEIRGHSMEGTEITDSIVGAAFSAMKESGATKVLVLTASGVTARVLSRYRLNKPVVAVTESATIARQLALSYGIKAGVGSKFKGDRDSVIESGLRTAKELGLVKKSDVIMVVSGSAVTPGYRKGGIIEVRKI